LLALLLLTLRGTPFIYYGEEIGMKEAKLPKSKLKDPIGLKWYPLHRGRDGCRTPMQWEAHKKAGFSKASAFWLPVGPEVERRNVATQEGDAQSLLNFYKRLIRMRKELPVLTEGSYQSVTEGIPEDCFCFRRKSGQQELLICLNFSLSRREIPFGGQEEPELLVSTDWQRLEDESRGKTAALEPFEGRLYRIN
jgi:alpha-glucosidase